MAETATKPAARTKRAAKPKPAPSTNGHGTGEKTVAGVAQGKMALLNAVPLTAIEVEPDFNPRMAMDEQAIDDLAASLKTHGMLQPVLLRPKPGADMQKAPRFYLTGGHRRFAAAQRAELTSIPALVRIDGDALVAAILDNSHRVDLNALEEARAYERAMREKGLTVKGVADTLDVPQRRVTERLRLLECPEVAQQGIAAGVLPMRDVAFYADLSQKSVLLATVLAQADVEAKGTLDGHGMNKVIEQTEGLVHPGQITAGSKFFKLTKPEVKAAVEELTEIAGGDYNDRRSWVGHRAVNEGLLGARLMSAGAKLEITLPGTMLEEGVKVGAVAHFESTEGGNSNWRVPVVAILDQRWLQSTLEELVVKTAEKAKKIKVRASSAGSGMGTSLSDDEKARRRQEREKDQRNRERAKESNTQLGIALVKHMGEIDPTNIDAIRALCLMLLSPYVSSYYADTGGRDVSLIAAGGLRFLWPEWKVETMTKGKEPKVKVNLENDRKKLNDHFWAWWNEAKTVEQILGRTLMAFTAVHYADRNEQMSKDHIGGAQSLPGHADAAAHIERLFDKHAPAALRKRKRGKGTVASTSKTLAEVLADSGALEDAGAVDTSIELTNAERDVFVALYKARGKGRYTGNSAGDVYRQLAEDLPSIKSQKLASETLDSLVAKRLVCGVKAAPFTNKAYDELAKALVLAEASRTGDDEEVRRAAVETGNVAAAES